MDVVETSDGLNETTSGLLDRALLSGRQAFLGFLTKRLGNRADAEDVLQDFYIRVLTHKNQLQNVARLEAWLYSVLRSALNDFYRKSGRRERLGAAYAMELKGEEEFTDAAEVLARICACVQEIIPDLRPTDADLIRRLDIQEENRKSVAADLGMTIATLAVRLHRARAALRDKLLRYCGCCCTDSFEDCSCQPVNGQGAQHRAQYASAM